MSNLDLIDRLQNIEYIINDYSNRLLATMPDYYDLFRMINKWNRQQEINRKCLAYWKRQFNKTLKQLEK